MAKLAGAPIRVEDVVIGWRESGVLEYDFREARRFELDQARAVVNAANRWVHEQGVVPPVLVLVRMSPVAKVSREAREELSNGEVERRLAARTALVATNAVSKNLASFFLGFNRPERPIEVFPDVDGALAWLRAPLEG